MFPSVIPSWLTALLALASAVVAEPPSCHDPCCPQDLTGDGVVNGADLGVLLSDWATADPCSDLDGDGVVSGADLGLLLGAWGPCVFLPGCPCPPSNHDCLTIGARGCNDPACCGLVCAVDVLCCQLAWDIGCVNQAASYCGSADCPFECPSGSMPAPESCGEDIDGGCEHAITSSDCCFEHASPGCDSPECEAAVCQDDPFCCETSWDLPCALAAVTACPALCAKEGREFGVLACGLTICGTTWADGNARDSDWYQLDSALVDFRTVTLSIQATMPMLIGVAAPQGAPDCDLVPELNPFVLASFCGSASFVTCLAPEARWFLAAPAVFQGFPCGTWNSYAITLLCEGDCEPPTCGAAGHDCLSPGGPACDDAKCCLVVCEETPHCCESAWDAACVEIAAKVCYATCPSSDHDCYTFGDAGCSDPTCCAAVCGFDPSCCEAFWDDLCVVNALVLCYAGCPPSDHDCFTVGTAGCSDEECCQTACLALAYCCNLLWDTQCVETAFQLCEAPLCSLECAPGSILEGEPCGEETNDGCFMADPAFEPLACGDTICATAWAVGGIRDTDWYELTGGEAGSARVCITTTLPLIVGVVGGSGCESFGSLNPNVAVTFCGTATLTFSYDGAKAWLYVAPLYFDGLPCELNSRYQITLSCAVAVSPCCDPTGCACDDDVCRACVCVDQPSCCNVCWDSVCAQAASPGGPCAKACPCDC